MYVHVWMYGCLCICAFACVTVCLCVHACIHVLFSCHFGDVAWLLFVCSKHRLLQECWRWSNDFMSADKSEAEERDEKQKGDKDRVRRVREGSGPRPKPGHSASVPLRSFYFMAPTLLGILPIFL